MQYMQLRKCVVLIGILLILTLSGGCYQQKTGGASLDKSKIEQPQSIEAQQNQSQPSEPSAPVPPPPDYLKVTNDTPKSTLEQECGKSTWPEFCTWIPEPDGRVLCEKCKELQSK